MTNSQAETFYLTSDTGYSNGLSWHDASKIVKEGGSIMDSNGKPVQRNAFENIKDGLQDGLSNVRSRV